MGLVGPTCAEGRAEHCVGRHRLERCQRIERPLDEVFAFFCAPANLERITPPFLRFRIRSPLPIEMRSGARIQYGISLFGVPISWRTVITVWEPGVRFVDEQESGPYAFWRHLHAFEPCGSGTRRCDVVEYVVPLGPLGALAHALFVRRILGRIFDDRRDAIERLFAP